MVAIRLLLLLLLGGGLSAQSPAPDTSGLSVARRHAHLADSLHTAPATAQKHALAALPVLKRAGAIAEVVHLRNGLNAVYRQLRDTNAWLANAGAAFDLARQLPPTNDTALAAANNLAVARRRLLDDLAGARRILEETYARLPPTAKPGLRGGLLYNIANNYFRLGDFRTAERYYATAAETYAELPDPPPVLLLRVAIERGRVQLAQGRTTDAVATLRTGLDLAKSLPAGHPETRRGRLHLSAALTQDGRSAAALELLATVPENRRTPEERYHRAVALADGGRNTAAEREVNDLIRLYGTSPVLRARAQVLAAGLTKPGTVGEVPARRRLEDALQGLCPDWQPGTPLPPCFPKVASTYELGRSLRALAARHAASADPADWTTALHYYADYFRLGDHARANFQSKDAQLLLLDATHEAYAEALAVVCRRYENAPTPELLDQALHLIAGGKSKLLRDEQRRRAGYRSSLTTDSLLRQQVALRAELADLREAAPTSAAVVRTERQLHQLEDRLATLAGPEDLPPADTNNLASVRRDLLTDGRALLAFLVGDSTTYRLIITPVAARLDRFASATISRERVAAFVNASRLRTRAELDTFRQLGRSFAAVLTDDSLIAGSDYLYLLTDGPLDVLPFAALPTGTPGQGYLVERSALHYVPSLHPPRKSVKTSGWASFYPLFRGEDRHQAVLDRRLAELNTGGGSRYAAAAADRATFRQRAPRAAVLVVGTHARLTPAGPSLSLSDGELRPGRLADRPLDAALAVLSACQTGGGAYARGEGTLSLARAFSYQGARATVHSLWSVPEAATVEQLAGFLDRLAAGDEPVAALRATQLAYLRDPGLPAAEQAPYYWSGLAFGGYCGPLPRARSAGRKWGVAGGALVCLLAVLLTVRYRRKPTG